MPVCRLHSLVVASVLYIRVCQRVIMLCCSTAAAVLRRSCVLQDQRRWPVSARICCGQACGKADMHATAPCTAAAVSCRLSPAEACHPGTSCMSHNLGSLMQGQSTLAQAP